MTLNKRIEHFAALGQNLLNLVSEGSQSIHYSFLLKAEQHNPWFTQNSIAHAISALAKQLTHDQITNWLSKYPLKNESLEKQIGLVMAGNIPLVGFHDMLCVLLTGNRVLAKLSAKDQHLYQLIKELLVKIDSGYDERITFTDQSLKQMDAIIATGSDNTSRYFEYYFKKYPHIIRKNRNSLAILDGKESEEELKLLADDILLYFGLGCRNVSQILVPEGFSFDRLLNSFTNYNTFLQVTKYANNYDYQKTILAMNRISFLDNGVLLLKEDQALSSPIATLNYKFYSGPSEVENYVQMNTDKIQCIVSKTKWPFLTYGFGKAQEPELNDYADGLDTIAFLNELN